MLEMLAAVWLARLLSMVEECTILARFNHSTSRCASADLLKSLWRWWKLWCMGEELIVRPMVWAGVIIPSGFGLGKQMRLY
jgi:hypothetical protein